MKIQFIIFFSLIVCNIAFAKNIETNHVVIKNAPAWLSRGIVERATERIQTKLEWYTRKITVNWYRTEKEFQQHHDFGPLAIAVTKNRGDTSVIHIGPKVTEKNFSETFGHELVHIIVFQKYRGAIPKWLEEGLANHLSDGGAVDYKWLAGQAFPDDVRNLAHPFGQRNGIDATESAIRYRYKASHAFAEMLDRKCDLQNLIRLSVGRKMEDYIKTYCEMPDMNKSFQAWVKQKARIR